MQVHNKNILLWHHEKGSSRKIQKKWRFSFLIASDHWNLRFLENECTEITQTIIQSMHDKSKHPAEDQRSFLLHATIPSPFTLHDILRGNRGTGLPSTQFWIILEFHIFMPLKEEVEGQGHHLDKHKVNVITSWTIISWWQWHVKQWGIQ